MEQEDGLLMMMHCRLPSRSAFSYSLLHSRLLLELRSEKPKGRPQRTEPRVPLGVLVGSKPSLLPGLLPFAVQMEMPMAPVLEVPARFFCGGERPPPPPDRSSPLPPPR